MSKRGLLLLIFTLVLTLLFAGLVNAVFGSRCGGESDCGAGERCVDRTCAIRFYDGVDEGTLSYQNAGTSQHLNSVYFINNNIGWVVGNNGVIKRTMNGGRDWTAQPSGTTNHLNSVFFISSTHGWAVGNNGRIIATTTGGTTWSYQGQPLGNVNFNSVHFVDPTNGWIVGDDRASLLNAPILATYSGGTEWLTTLGRNYQGNYNFVYSLRRATLFVGDYGTLIMHQTRNDNSIPFSWNRGPGGTAKNLNEVHAVIDPNDPTKARVWIAGDDELVASVLLRLRGSGSSSGWDFASNRLTIPQGLGTKHLHSVFFSDYNNGWFVGDDGRIIHYAAATPPPPPPPILCTGAQDCPPGGYTCAAGICELSSTARVLLAQGRTASTLNCDRSRLPKIGQRCLRDDTCACGEQCTDRICEETGTSTSGFVCTSDRNCNAGESCVNNACAIGYVGQCPLSALRNSCGCQNSNSCNGLSLGLCSSASARAIPCAAGHQCSVVNGRASCVPRQPQETGTPAQGETQQQTQQQTQQPQQTDCGNPSQGWTCENYRYTAGTPPEQRSVATPSFCVRSSIHIPGSALGVGEEVRYCSTTAYCSRISSTVFNCLPKKGIDVQCAANHECTSANCVNGRCGPQALPPPPPSCTQDTDCPGGAYCSNNQCVTDCGFHSEGWRCNPTGNACVRGTTTRDCGVYYYCGSSVQRTRSVGLSRTEQLYSCFSKKADGRSCNEHYECKDISYCDEGTARCSAKQPDGAFCFDNRYCLSTTCGPAERCAPAQQPPQQPPPVLRNAGEPCTDHPQCASGSCADPDGDRTKTCQTSRPGISCGPTVPRGTNCGVLSFLDGTVYPLSCGSDNLCGGGGASCASTPVQSRSSSSPNSGLAGSSSVSSVSLGLSPSPVALSYTSRNQLCASGSCANGVCTIPPTRGEACTSTQYCAGGIPCPPTFLRCPPRVSCSSQTSCPDGTACPTTGAQAGICSSVTCRNDPQCRRTVAGSLISSEVCSRGLCVTMGGTRCGTPVCSDGNPCPASGTCPTACSSCRPEQRCDNGRCTIPTNTACQPGDTCAGGISCPSTGTCPLPCSRDTDCGPGLLCSNNGICTIPNGGGCTSGTLCADGTSCPTTGTCPQGCPTVSCASRETCEQGSCRINAGESCTRTQTCAGGIPCPSDGVCPSTPSTCTPACGPRQTCVNGRCENTQQPQCENSNQCGGPTLICNENGQCVTRSNNRDDNSDGDGQNNNNDQTPNGRGSTGDLDGDGRLNNDDLDLDGDGVLNRFDPDVDGDGILNGQDDDDDGDGLLDTDPSETTPRGRQGDPNDLDGDEIPNASDIDIDGDGISNTQDADIDGDGILNVFDNDVDGDGILNDQDTDDDGDGLLDTDPSETTPRGIGNRDNFDGDTLRNADDLDIDGDGVLNRFDPDVDGDGILNGQDDDDDGDGIPDATDSTPRGRIGDTNDLDGDAIGNENDSDVDGDGRNNEGDSDIDGDGIINFFDRDVDGDARFNDLDPRAEELLNIRPPTPPTGCTGGPDLDNDGVLGDTLTGACDQCPGTTASQRGAGFNSQTGCGVGQRPREFPRCSQVGGVVCPLGSACNTGTTSPTTIEIGCCLSDRGIAPACQTDTPLSVRVPSITISKGACDDQDGDGQGTRQVTITAGATGSEVLLQEITRLGGIQAVLPECLTEPCTQQPGAATWSVPCTAINSRADRVIVSTYSASAAILTLFIIAGYYLLRKKRKA